MVKYVRHPAEDYEKPTTPFLEQYGMSDGEAFEDIRGRVYEALLGAIRCGMEESYEQMQEITKRLFVDADMAADYEDVADEITAILVACIMHDFVPDEPQIVEEDDDEFDIDEG